MGLVEVVNTSEFKKSFLRNFGELREANPSFNKFIYEVSLNNNLFIVGGYLRCIANNEIPRDLDLIINLDHTKLNDVVKNCFFNFSVNRMGGYKIQLETIVIDLWSIEDNWAFKKRVVKNIHSNYLEKIAKGTFFNYDSLVFDLHTQQYNFKNYNICSKTRVLDILKKNSTYKKLNPTREANILRALYLKHRYDLTFSDQLEAYVLEYLKYASQTFGDASAKLRETLQRYPKYHHIIHPKNIEEFINKIQVTTKNFTPSINSDLFSSDVKE